MIHASFVGKILIPAIVLYAIITVITLFSNSRARRARLAYEKGGVIGFAENLKMGYLKGEAAERLEVAQVIDLALRKIEDRRARMARLEKIFSIKTSLIIAGALIAAVIVTLLGHLLLGLSQEPFIWLVIGIGSFYGLFMLAGLAGSMIITMLKASDESILKLLERARADLASGVAPSAPVTIPAAGFEPTYIIGTGRDYQAVRAELGTLFERSRFKPWMGCIPVFVLLGVQLFLTMGEHYGERSYDNPWLMFSLFALATLLEFLVAIRFVYFANVILYAQKGPEGLKGSGVPLTSNPGSQALLVFTAMGLVPSVFGFVFFFVCSNWPVSLAFHAVSLLHVFYFQFKLDSFTDRMADNVIYLASQPKEAMGLGGIFKIARRMFSR